MQWRMPKRIIQRQMPTVIWVVADSVATTIYKRSFDYFGAIWVVGTALMLARSIRVRSRLARVVGSARTVLKLGPVPVRMTGEIQGPGVCGIWHPAILVPEAVLTWNPSVRRAVFMHEVAHIRRRDTFTLLIAEMARAIYWFHPLTWLAFSELRKECERACDDAALRIGLRPSSYAGHLLDLARTFPFEPAIPMATTSHLESRMKAILDPRVKRNAAAPWAWLTAAAATVAMLIPLSAFSLQAQSDQSQNDKLRAERAAQESGQSPSRPIRVGGKVIEANLIQKVTPIYPAAAKERRSQGTVLLDVLIGKDGVPAGVEPKPSDVDPDLTAAAVEAVRQWRYKPTLLNGEPVEVQTTVEVNFTLQQ